MTKILAFAGSARTASFNKKLVRVAAGLLREAGAETTLLDLREHPLPLYDGDLEDAEGVPDNAATLRGLMIAHDGLLLSCPEYNSSITPLLKNVIDWVSRPAEGVRPLEAFTGKTAALLAASPGALGGLRGLVHVRSILGNIGVHVLPRQIAVPRAHEAFEADGALRDEKLAGQVRAMMQEFVETTAKLTG